jgi:hypothetical protein
MTSTIVFTIIDNIKNLANATWRMGEQTSYKQNAIAIQDKGKWRDIRLIGRRDKYGTVSPCYVVVHGELKPICSWHITLANFFLNALERGPNGLTLHPFIEDIPADPAYAARQLMSVDCGIDQPVGDETVRNAALAIMTILRALGVPAGDWTFLPLLTAYHTNDKRNN